MGRRSFESPSNEAARGRVQFVTQRISTAPAGLELDGVDYCRSPSSSSTFSHEQSGSSGSCLSRSSTAPVAYTIPTILLNGQRTCDTMDFEKAERREDLLKSLGHPQAIATPGFVSESSEDECYVLEAANEILAGADREECTLSIKSGRKRLASTHSHTSMTSESTCFRSISRSSSASKASSTLWSMASSVLKMGAGDLQEFHSHGVVPVEVNSRSTSKSSCAPSESSSNSSHSSSQPKSIKASRSLCFACRCEYCDCFGSDDFHAVEWQACKDTPRRDKRSVFPGDVALDIEHRRSTVLKQRAKTDCCTRGIAAEAEGMMCSADHPSKDARSPGSSRGSPKTGSLCTRIGTSIRKSLSCVRSTRGRGIRHQTMDEIMRAKDDQLLASLRMRHD